jgi:3-oxoacyl-[acyl-carrier-protein] synthase II
VSDIKNADRKAVVTGLGVLSPVGTGRNAFWESLIQGRTGIRPVTLFDTASFNVHVAGEIIDFDPVALLGKKGLRTLDRSTRLISSAAKLALDDAKLEVTSNNTGSMGISVGTTFGSLHSIAQFDRVGLIEGPRYVNPSLFPNTVINSPASQVSIRLGIKGFNTTVSTGFCAGLDAISYACDFIRLNRADVVLAGSVEELCEETFLGFHNLGCLSGSDGSNPISCPFDARRTGVVLAEGAAILVLEEEEHALKRGADILGKISGCGNSFDPSAEKNFVHKGNGLRQAVSLALKDASLEPNDIDYVSSCANSTRGLDCMETKVLKNVFGEYAFKVPVSSIKSMIGESFSASGALSVAAAIGVINKGIIPPTVNYQQKDSECDLDYVPNQSRQKQTENILVTSADPYGQNSAIVISKYGR